MGPELVELWLNRDSLVPYLSPRCPVWKQCVALPFDNLQRLIFADYISEQGMDGLATHIRSAIAGRTPMDLLYTFYWFHNFCRAMRPFHSSILDWVDGLPSVINLEINSHSWYVYSLRSDFHLSPIKSANRTGRSIPGYSNVRILFNNWLQLFPIRKIIALPFTIFPVHGIAILEMPDSYEVYHYLEFNPTLEYWWSRLLHVIGGTGLGYVVCGYGNVWLAQYARSVTVRDQQRPSPDDRLVAYSIPKDAPIVERNGTVTICGFQYSVRPIPLE